MNKERRKEIDAVISKLNDLKGDMDIILSDVEDIKDAEEEYMNSIPDNLQGSERFEKAEKAVDNLDCAYDTFSNILDNIDDVISSLEEAKE